MTDRPRAWGLVAPYATAFLSSACVMIIELVAGRIVSRHLGASLYTWTSVIGVILAGLAAGNYVGGRLADRFAPRRTLGWLFLAASASCVLVSAADTLVGRWTALWELSWPARVATHVTLVFFVPAAVLGTVGPVVARMALDAGRATGRTLGSIYAWGVIGSLVGTFATGYVLVSWMGTTMIVWAVAAVLAATGLAYVPGRRGAWGWTGVLLVTAVLAHAPWSWARAAGESLALREHLDPTVVYSDESRYFHIEVREDPLRPGTRGLYLDKLLHSQTSLAEPDRLLYGYATVFAEITGRLVAPDAAPHTLCIGGGGYVFPRYLARRWPRGRHEVIEIDPAVTRAAHEAFGLPEDTPLVIRHGDGRAFVSDLARRGELGQRLPRYDVIYLDAVNDFAVPFQLTTVEFFADVKRLLAPGGVLLVNSIDVVGSGALVGALRHTLGDVFSEVAVYAEIDPTRIGTDSRLTLILGASERPLPTSLTAPMTRVAPDTVAAWVDDASGMTLTDAHAPVENLMAPVVRASARSHGASEILRRALIRADSGDVDGFVDGCREALRQDPDLADAHYNLGVGLYHQGDAAEAVRQWERAVRLAPDYAAAQFNLGAAYYGMGRLDAALEHLRAAVRLEPRLPAGHTGLATALEAAGDLVAARDHLREALRLDPDQSEARAGLARVDARLDGQGTVGGS